MGETYKNNSADTASAKPKCYYLSFEIPNSCTINEKSRQEILSDILEKAASDNSKHKYVYAPGSKGTTLPKTLLITHSHQIPLKLMQMNYEQRPPYHGIVAIEEDPSSPLTIAHDSKNRHKTGFVDTEALRLKNLQSVYLPVTPDIQPENFPSARIYNQDGNHFLKIDVPEALRNADTQTNSHQADINSDDFHTMKFK